MNPALLSAFWQHLIFVLFIFLNQMQNDIQKKLGSTGDMYTYLLRGDLDRLDQGKKIDCHHIILLHKNTT